MTSEIVSSGRHIPSFILTVEDANGPRRKSAHEQLSHAGIKGTFVTGFNKQSPIVNQLYAPWLNRLLAKRSMGLAEIAAYAGHRKIWQEIVDSQIDAALIFEDDFSIIDVEHFMRCLNVSLSNRYHWDIVKFFDFLPKKIEVQKVIDDVNFVLYKYPASGLVCYLITKSAAERLLKRSRIFRPVDEDIAHTWEFNIRVWSVTPNPIAEISNTLGGSLIEQNRLDMKRDRKLVRVIWANVLAAVKAFRSKIHNSRFKN